MEFIHANFTKVNFWNFKALAITAMFFVINAPFLMAENIQTLDCPDDEVIDLLPGECESIVLFDNLSWTSSVPLASHSFEPASGSTFGIGSHDVLLIGIDSMGNADTCNFAVIINEFANPTQFLVCNNFVQVSLGIDCTAEIVADIMLEGGPYGCYDNYNVAILDDLGQPFPTAIVDASFLDQTWTVSIEDPQTGNLCWGTLSVEDKLDPVVDCFEEVEVALFSLGQVEIWTSDFLGNSFDNCGDITGSFSPTPNNPSLVLDCNDLGPNVIEIWIIDESGNSSSCEVIINLTDPLDVCGDNQILSGKTLRPNDDPVSEVEINAAGTLGFDETTLNEIDGSYSIPAPMDQDYIISAYKDGDDLNGVSTFDVILILRHILGIDPLESPYQIIAADVNLSGAVTTLDVILIRKLILFIDDSFQETDSWRFVEAAFDFPDPNNPFATAIPSTINTSDYTNLDELDFVAIKMGDINGNDPGFTGDDSDDRNAMDDDFSIQTTDRILHKGENLKIPFTADLEKMMGFQFTLEFDPQQLNFKGFQGGLLNSENAGLQFAENGQITFSWADVASKMETGNQTLFYLEFESNSTQLLSNNLNLNNNLTKAEAYTNNLERTNLQLTFGNAPSAMSENFQLKQNQPNPFSTVTQIGFYVPDATFVEFKIYNVSGQIIQQKSTQVEKGWNQFQIQDLPNAGIYFYEIETAFGQEVRKMTKL